MASLNSDKLQASTKEFQSGKKTLYLPIMWTWPSYLIDEIVHVDNMDT